MLRRKFSIHRWQYEYISIFKFLTAKFHRFILVSCQYFISIETVVVMVLGMNCFVSGELWQCFYIASMNLSFPDETEILWLITPLTTEIGNGCDKEYIENAVLQIRDVLSVHLLYCFCFVRCVFGSLWKIQRYELY